MTNLGRRTAWGLIFLASCIHHDGGRARSREGGGDGDLAVRVDREGDRRARRDDRRDDDRRDDDRDRDRVARRDDDDRPARRTRSLSDQERRGIEWVVAHQLPSGGWGQGDEAPNMGGSGEMRDVGNVADTCVATLALVRAGSTAGSGPHRDAVRRGVEFVLAEVEESDATSLAVTDITGTRVQGKIGQFVDTFASLVLLTEVKGRMGERDREHRVERALDKIVRKIERNQNEDGTWANQGWAPTLSQGLAALGLNRATQGGMDVPADVLSRVEAQADAQFDERSGAFARGAGSAGVEIYQGAASSSALRASAETHRQQRADLERQASRGNADERARARRQLDRGRRVESDAEQAEAGLVGRLNDPGFVGGFGSNGGEEFLSYMLISETLAARGGERFDEWNGRMKELLAGVQNNDGSWTGHHCITGRTFCTSAALLVLLADQSRGSASLRDIRG